jgi:hypothetical protein
MGPKLSGLEADRGSSKKERIERRGKLEPSKK